MINIGIVQNEFEARGVCDCFKIDGEMLCHRPGIIGFMSNKQERQYCTDKTIEKVPIRIKERHREFAKISDLCSERVSGKHKRGERLMPYLACVSREADARGIEL